MHLPSREQDRRDSHSSDDDCSSEGSECKDFDYNSSTDGDAHSAGCRTFVRGPTAFRRNNFSGVPRAQSMLSLGEFDAKGKSRKGLLDTKGHLQERLLEPQGLRKVKTYQHPLSDFKQVQTLRQLQSEVSYLAYRMKLKNRKGGFFLILWWHASIITNVILALRVFSSQLLHYAKKDLGVGKVVGRYIRQAASKAGPAVLQRSKQKQASDINILSLYRGYKVDSLRAACWSTPFIAVAYLIFKNDEYNVQNWAVLGASIYSSLLPSLTTATIRPLSRLHIVANAAYLLTRHYHILSQFDMKVL